MSITTGIGVLMSEVEAVGGWVLIKTILYYYKVDTMFDSQVPATFHDKTEWFYYKIDKLTIQLDHSSFSHKTVLLKL